MRRLLLLLLVALLIAAGAILYATAESLPPHVASSFNFAGDAGGFMRRGTYLVFMAAAIFGAAAIILLVCAVLPRLAPRLVNIPARASTGSRPSVARKPMRASQHRGLCSPAW